MENDAKRWDNGSRHMSFPKALDIYFVVYLTPAHVDGIQENDNWKRQKFKARICPNVIWEATSQIRDVPRAPALRFQLQNKDNFVVATENFP